MTTKWRIPGRPQQMLPVAGIDAAEAQSLAYALRLHIGPEQADAVAAEWVEALVMAQVASDRLLLSADAAQRTAAFWRSVACAGGARRMLLLGQGPVALAQTSWAWLRSAHLGLSAVEWTQKKLVVLGQLEAMLAAALAEVHDAAGGLRLPGSGVGAPSGEVLKGAALAQAAHDAAARCAAATADALCRLQPTSEGAADGRLHRGPGQGDGAAEQLRWMLGLQSSQLPHCAGDVAAALHAAHAAAAGLGPLVDVPPRASMPSHFQRHWIGYLAGATASVSALTFLYRHSRLSGSSDLDNWVASAAATLRGSWQVHVVDPLAAVGDELFATFRDRPSIVSPHEFETDKAALLRMIREVGGEQPPASSLPAAGASSSIGGGRNGTAAAAAPAGAPPSLDASIAAGMGAVMAAYEAQLRSPLRNLVAGSLMQLLLIQVQRLKVDTMAAMLELDQILRANELSISLLAAVPSLAVAAAALRALARLLAPRAPDAKREAVPCRMAMVEVERALVRLQHDHSPEAHGRLVVRLQRLYLEVTRVYRLRDRKSRYSEWPLLQREVLELAHPLAPATAAVASGAGADKVAAQRLEMQQRMTRSYALFQP